MVTIACPYCHHEMEHVVWGWICHKCHATWGDIEPEDAQ